MYKILTTKRFDKKIQRIKSNSLRIRNIKDTIMLLSENPFETKLNTHKLSGKLSNFYSCSCGYDCRILFSLEPGIDNEQFLLLIDLGTHDEVY